MSRKAFDDRPTRAAHHRALAFTNLDLAAACRRAIGAKLVRVPESAMRANLCSHRETLAEAAKEDLFAGLDGLRLP